MLNWVIGVEVGQTHEALKVKGVLEIYERQIGEREWRLIVKTHNLVPYDGKHMIAELMMGNSAQHYNKDNAYFMWSNGTNDPADTDTVADFLADGNGGYKQVSNVVYLADERKIKTEMFLSSLEGNNPGQITKIGLTNKVPTSPYGRLYAEMKFDALTKNDEKEFLFLHYLELV